MIFAIVPSIPPSASLGVANATGTPLRRSPRDKRRLLIYTDAVCKLLESIEACDGANERAREYLGANVVSMSSLFDCKQTGKVAAVDRLFLPHSEARVGH